MSARRLKILTNWNIACGGTLETLRLMGSSVYKYMNKSLAVMEEYPRGLRKFTSHRIYKHVALDNWVQINDFIANDEPSRELIRKLLSNQDSEPAFTLNEFLKLTKGTPDYYRLIYIGKPIHHVYITDDWIVLGGVGANYGTSIPEPS